LALLPFYAREAKEGLIIEWSDDSDAKDGKRDDTD